MSVGIFYQNDVNTTRRDACFMLVDASDPLSAMTDQAGGQPQIRKPGASTWTNTSATLVHVGSGHYTVLLTTAEIDTQGVGSIRYQDGGATVAEFQDTFFVRPPLETTNENIQQMLLKILQKLNWLIHVIQKDQGDSLANKELSIL